MGANRTHGTLSARRSASGSLIARLDGPLIDAVGPAWRTLQAVETIGQKRPLTDALLAGRIHGSRRTVRRHLTTLRQSGLISTTRTGRGLAVLLAPSTDSLFLPPFPIPGPRQTLSNQSSADLLPQIANARRDQLVIDHQDLVRRVAQSCAKKLPFWLELDDLISAGQLGLIEAAEKYDPERGIPFAGFAYRFIRGRIIDSNRRRNYDWELHETLDSQPFADPSLASTELELNRGQTREAIERALEYLDERDELACRTYLEPSQTLRSLGDQLGVTESGACLIRNRARGRLREQLELEGLGKCDVSLAA